MSTLNSYEPKLGDRGWLFLGGSEKPAFGVVASVPQTGRVTVVAAGLLGKPTLLGLDAYVHTDKGCGQATPYFQPEFCWAAPDCHRADGWMSWSGGERPVPQGVKVDYVMRCGAHHRDPAAGVYWGAFGKPGDIVAYRVVVEDSVDADGRDCEEKHLEALVVDAVKAVMKKTGASGFCWIDSLGISVSCSTDSSRLAHLAASAGAKVSGPSELEQLAALTQLVRAASAAADLPLGADPIETLVPAIEKLKARSGSATEDPNDTRLRLEREAMTACHRVLDFMGAETCGLGAYSGKDPQVFLAFSRKADRLTDMAATVVGTAAARAEPVQQQHPLEQFIDKAPAWAGFLAQDENGQVWAFEGEPRSYSDGQVWASDHGGGRAALLYNADRNEKWRDTLLSLKSRTDKAEAKLDPVGQLQPGEQEQPGQQVTKAMVEDEIAVERYFTAAEGYLGSSLLEDGPIALPDSYTPPPPDLNQITICVMILKNGHKVVGVNHGSIDPAKHDPEKGRAFARREALDKVWELLGFRLREQAVEDAELRAAIRESIWRGLGVHLNSSSRIIGGADC